MQLQRFNIIFKRKKINFSLIAVKLGKNQSEFSNFV